MIYGILHAKNLNNMDIKEILPVKKLQDAFMNDRPKAEKLYKNKIVTITGVVVYVGPDVYGLPSIELSDKKDGAAMALCVLPVSDYLKLRKYSKGQTLVITGEARDLYKESIVIVKECKIIEEKFKTYGMKTILNEKEPSPESQQLEKKLFLLGVKNNTFAQTVKNDRAKPAAKPTPELYNKYDIASEVVNGQNVWTIAPKETINKYFFFIHGGAYVSSYFPEHWVFFGRLIERTGRTVVTPDYPLAPEHQFEETTEMVYTALVNLIDKAGAQNVILIGDSAGEGMAFALSQKLRDEKGAQPSQIILLSPLLDMTKSNPEIVEVDKYDPILSVERSTACSKAYAGNEDPKNYLLSPIYGNIKNLAPIVLFTGTHDILFPDCKKLSQMAKKENINLTYCEYKDMLHVWLILPVPEANEALDQLIDLLV
jgi:monoterpene epsilon-lactone hydrolase